MANEETNLLRIRAEDTNESAARSGRVILWGTLLSLSLLALASAILKRGLSERERRRLRRARALERRAQAG